MGSGRSRGVWTRLAALALVVVAIVVGRTEVTPMIRYVETDGNAPVVKLDLTPAVDSAVATPVDVRTRGQALVAVLAALVALCGSLEPVRRVAPQRRAGRRGVERRSRPTRAPPVLLASA